MNKGNYRWQRILGYIVHVSPMDSLSVRFRETGTALWASTRNVATFWFNYIRLAHLRNRDRTIDKVFLTLLVMSDCVSSICKHTAVYAFRSNSWLVARSPRKILMRQWGRGLAKMMLIPSIDSYIQYLSPQRAFVRWLGSEEKATANLSRKAPPTKIYLNWRVE